MSDEEVTFRNLFCHFCGKSKDQVSKLIAGKGVYICNECVSISNEIIAEPAVHDKGVRVKEFTDDLLSPRDLALIESYNPVSKQSLSGIIENAFDLINGEGAEDSALGLFFTSLHTQLQQALKEACKKRIDFLRSCINEVKVSDPRYDLSFFEEQIASLEARISSLSG